MKQLVRPLLKNGLLLSEDEYWKRQRTLVSPAFHYSALHCMVPMMVDAALDMSVTHLNPIIITPQLFHHPFSEFDILWDFHGGGLRQR